MSSTPLELLKSRRFGPLFGTQFLGAANDNVFKNALVILITYRLAEAAGLDGRVLVTLAAGVFILPFFLFSATAGQLADKLEKSRFIQRIKVGEIAIMLLAGLGFMMESPLFLLFVLFLMGTQSAFFGPLKYAILPDHLQEDELIAGNGLIEAGTFLAILLGTIVGGLLILADGGVGAISLLVLGVAGLGWWFSRRIPEAPPADPDLSVSFNVATATWKILKQVGEKRSVFLSVLGISWFWLVGATYLTQFPTFAKEVLGADQEVVTLFLTVFSIGIGIGSLLCNRLLKGEVNAKYVPFGALGLSFFTFDLYLASGGGVAATGGALMGAGAFLDHGANWRIFIDLLLIAISGGIYIVPLYAILQSRSDAARRSRAIAGNNVVNALFMVISAVGTMVMLAADFSVPQVFLAMGVANLAVGAYICALLPEEVLKTLFRRLFRLLYRVEVKGLENFEKAGERAVIVVNHVSFLDGALLAAFLPGKPAFAINTQMAKKWWVKPFLSVIHAVPLDPTNPFALKSLAKFVKEGHRCVIFPEGRITVTGALMKVYEGPGVIADRAGAQLVPVRIDGAQYTPFSRLKGKVRTRWFPKLTVTILPPRLLEIPEGVKGRERRRHVGMNLYDMLTEMLVETGDADRTLWQALEDARAVHGSSHVALEDVAREPIGYGKLVLASLILGRKITPLTYPEERVGVLLPNAIGAAATFFALQAYGRVPAMLNFTMGLENLRSACKTAEVRTILTSRRFVEMAKLDAVILDLAKQIRIVYLEDLKEGIGLIDKLEGLFSSLASRWRRWTTAASPEDPAVVLFTSGSEGAPKGVVLSHSNLLSNAIQLSSRVDYNPTDVVFNALPMFHSFGLTGGTLLPLFGGIKTFLYPSPLHYRIVAELTYDSNATILFGTDTFLNGYARVAHPYDFYSVRYVFAGAEKVKEATRKTWMDKFGLRILEGYGATETSPALAANTPMQFKAGSVGRLLPGISSRLDPVPGIERGGRLVVSGPNVMLGYLLSDRPGVLQPPPGGEYDTGDIVEIDGEGFVTIVGRAKRFAKVAGEMVSLTAVEGHAAGLWPENMHAVVSVPDARKGEGLILVTDCPGADRKGLLAYARERGIPELMIPKTVQIVDSVPLLGTGKIDYPGVQALVETPAG